MQGTKFENVIFSHVQGRNEKELQKHEINVFVINNRKYISILSKMTKIPTKKYHRSLTEIMSSFLYTTLPAKGRNEKELQQ